MKKNPIFEEMCKNIPFSIKRAVDLSFDLSNALDTVMKENKLTIQDAAQKCKLSQKRIRKYLSGSYCFDLYDIGKLEEGLGVHFIAIITKKNLIQRNK